MPHVLQQVSSFTLPEGEVILCYLISKGRPSYITPAVLQEGSSSTPFVLKRVSYITPPVLQEGTSPTPLVL